MRKRKNWLFKNLENLFYMLGDRRSRLNKKKIRDFDEKIKKKKLDDGWIKGVEIV